MTAVFWTGLAVWLLFAVAPVRYFLGLVPRRRRWGLAAAGSRPTGRLMRPAGCAMDSLPLAVQGGEGDRGRGLSWRAWQGPVALSSITVAAPADEVRPAFPVTWLNGCLPAGAALPPPGSTVTAGLSYQETLGGGQRKGLDDRYEPEVGGGGDP